MRETPRSLGLYFTLCSLFSLPGLLIFGASLAELTAHPDWTTFLITAIMLFNGIVGAYMLRVGLNLSWFLAKRPQLPLRVAKASILASLLTFNVIGVLLNSYTLINLKRLATEAQIEPEQRVLR